MKILIFGNLASGKSYLCNKILEAIPDLEFLAIDNFRKMFGDGTMDKEIVAKHEFLNNIKLGKFQLIEATGLGDKEEAILDILKEREELKLIIIIKTPLETCLERMEIRVWDVPYPAPPKQAFKLAEQIDKLIKENAIHKLWNNAVNHRIIEIQDISDNNISSLIKTLNVLRNEAN